MKTGEFEPDPTFCLISFADVMSNYSAPLSGLANTIREDLLIN